MTDIVEQSDGHHMDRAAFLQQCKHRALQYVNNGDLVGALASMASDLRKHPEIQGNPSLILIASLAVNGDLSTAEDVRDFITNFQ